MISKKAEMSIELMIGVVIALIVLGVLVFAFLFKGANVARTTTQCESFGGVLVPDACDSSVANRFSIGDDKEGNVCCKKKITVSDDEYNKWVEIAPVVSSSGVGSSSLSSSSGIQSRISESYVSKTNIIMDFNDKQYQNEPFEIAAGEPFVIGAAHNIDGGNYCHLYVFEAEKSGSGWQAKPDGKVTVLGGMSYKDNNCGPADGSLLKLQIDNAITREGVYKADFIVKDKESGTNLASATVVFRVKAVTDTTTPSGEPRNIQPTISITKTQDSRQQKIYCWIDVSVEDYEIPLENSYTLKSIITAKPCSQETYTNFNPGGQITLNKDENFCLQAQQTYTDANGVDRIITKRAAYSYNECDYVKVYSESETSLGCSPICETYDSGAGSKSSKCNNYKSRDPGCQFSLDCYEKKPKLAITNNRNVCVKCPSEVTTCAKYRTEGSCIENDCIQDEKCEWAKKFLGGDCIPYKE